MHPPESGEIARGEKTGGHHDRGQVQQLNPCTAFDLFQLRDLQHQQSTTQAVEQPTRPENRLASLRDDGEVTLPHQHVRDQGHKTHQERRIQTILALARKVEIRA